MIQNTSVGQVSIVHNISTGQTKIQNISLGKGSIVQNVSVANPGASYAGIMCSNSPLLGGDPAEDHQGPGHPAGREGGQEDREGQQGGEDTQVHIRWIIHILKVVRIKCSR